MRNKQALVRESVNILVSSRHMANSCHSDEWHWQDL